MKIVNTRMIFDSIVERNFDDLKAGLLYTQVISDSVKDFNLGGRQLEQSNWMYLGFSKSENRRIFGVGFCNVVLEQRRAIPEESPTIPLVMSDETGSCDVEMIPDKLFDQEWGYLVRRGTKEKFLGIYLFYDQDNDRSYLYHGVKGINTIRRRKKKKFSLESFFTPSLRPLEV